ncbi:MAG: cyclic nucleotide-binding domain-containing protein [Magnetovibrio sp.]|nr:cyclic nucleotide-binding domain-containing protein [Magnetovibrio sp.]
MARTTQTFDDGAFIYRQGDPSDCAFEVLVGEVELLADDGATEARTALIPPGQMFGEMGLVGGGPRDTSARAVGPVKVRIIRGEQAGPAAEREKKKGVLSRFIEQLGVPATAPQATDAAPGAAAEAAPAAPAAGGFFQRVIDRVQPMEGRLEARLALLSGDADGSHTRRVAQAFDCFRDINVRIVNKALEIDFDKDLAAEIGRVARTGRRWLKAQQADILIWGHVPAPGATLHLHFVPLAKWDERLVGVFDLTTDLPLPADVPEPFQDLLRAATLAATVPSTRDKARLRKALLPEAALAAGRAFAELPGELTSRERGALHLCHGNVLAMAWSLARADDLRAAAVTAYRLATSTVTSEESPIDWAMAQRHLSSLYYAEAEAAGEAARYEEAAAAALSALEVLSRDETPFEWAALQHRLGLVHYKLGFDTGHTGVLRQALHYHQQALRVYTRQQTTEQWAEVMSSFAQAAQVFGEHVKSLEALATAANACHAVLQVRDRKRAPMAWAATQNNLGSALFLLGKKANNPSRLEAAIQAFEMALEVYEARNAHRAAAVTAKNLERARRLLEYLTPAYEVELDLAHLELPSDPGEPTLVDVGDIGAGRSGNSLLN